MNLPTLRQLQHFAALAETLSFSRAADYCHVTQSTLSASLAQLESILGQKLFDRGTRKVNLTPVGKDLLEPAHAIIQQAENLVRQAKKQHAPLSRTLSLGIIPTIAPYLLPRMLPAIHDSYPNLDLILREDITSRQVESLRRGQVDLILMAFPYDTQGMDTMMLWEEYFVLAHNDDAIKSSKKFDVADLQNEKILLLDDGHCLRDHAIAACRLTPSAGRKKLGATSLQTLIQMVQHGYGSTLLPEMAAQPEFLGKDILIQRFGSPPPSRQIGLAWRHNDPRSGEFRLLGTFIQKIGQKTPEK